MQSPIPNPQSEILIGGTIAIDHVKTPVSEASDLLGGSASYAALAASYFTSAVHLVGIIGKDFPKAHLDLLESRGITLEGVERSEGDSFSWSGEYHENMNDRTTRKVDINVLENWTVKVPQSLPAGARIIVLANMSPDNQLQMLDAISNRGVAAPSADSSNPQFIVADTMDLWISIANERLHEVFKRIDLLVLNESEARDLAETPNLILAGRRLLAKGPRHVVIKLGEFGSLLISKDCGVGSTECGSKEISADSLSFSSITNSDLSIPHSYRLFRCAAFPLEEVADPTGAGDSFLGALAGHLASSGNSEFTFEEIRQGIVLGTVVASFTCEAFSTHRLQEITPSDIQSRMEHLKSITHWI